jgi:hypothetical protein
VEAQSRDVASADWIEVKDGRIAGQWLYFDSPAFGAAVFGGPVTQAVSAA